MTRVLVVDLDDTLYSELEYLKSAYRFIASQLTSDKNQLYELMIYKYFNSEDVFKFLISHYDIEMSTLLNWYRFHDPEIYLYASVRETLEYHSKYAEVALITDGRSKTQRNKIKALKLETVLASIVISEEIGSEKPCQANFKKVMIETKGDDYIYVGDNLKKDFITPNTLGWMTLCLRDQGNNVHKQDFTLSNDYQPQHCFESWFEIKRFLDKL